MSSFHKNKEIKITTVGSKVMISRRMLTRFSRFSQYLNRFNSNFQPMNSRWNENLVIFTMALVSTCFDDQIKIRIFGAY